MDLGDKGFSFVIEKLKHPDMKVKFRMANGTMQRIVGSKEAHFPVGCTVLTFENGARLIKQTQTLFVIQGYHPEGNDVMEALFIFLEMMGKAK